MDLSMIGLWVSSKWPFITTIVSVLWLVEKLLETIGTVTKNKLVDNIGVYLGDALVALFPKSQPPVPPVAPVVPAV